MISLSKCASILLLLNLSYTIKLSILQNAAAQLEKMINRWASDIVRSPPVSLIDLCGAILNDLASTITETAPRYDGSSIQVQSLLRHIISETVCAHAQSSTLRMLTI